MPEALCVPHKLRGLTVAAHRIVDRVPKCDDCYQGKPIQGGAAEPAAPPKTKHEGRSAVPEKLEIDWNAVQRDRDAGIPVAELVKKYHASNPTIYLHTHATGG